MLHREDMTPEQKEYTLRAVAGAENFVVLGVGFGKTIVVLSAIVDLRAKHGPLRTLVISTKNIIERTWGPEIAQWEHTAGLTYAAATGYKGRFERIACSPVDVLGVNFESLERYYDLVDAGRAPLPEILVIDESDGMKSHGAKRVKRHCGFGGRRGESGYVHHFQFRFALSATPTAEGYAEIWAQECSISLERRLGLNITTFRAEYCNARHNGVSVEYTVTEDAKRRIHDALADILTTSTGDDYLGLPPPTYSRVLIPWDPVEKARYDRMEEDSLIELEELEARGLTILAPSVGVLFNKLRQMASGFLYHTPPGEPRETIWFDSAADKLAALEEIKERAAGVPLLVFVQFQAEMELIAEHFKDATIGLPADLADWDSHRIPMMVLHPRSGGHGLNLQFGSHIAVWYSLPWPYRQWHQANGRLQRMGQTEQVSIIRLEHEASIDGDVWKRLQGKAGTLRQFIDGIRARQRRG